MLLHQHTITLLKIIKLYIAHTQAITPRFIHICRPNTLKCRTNLSLSLRSFRSGIQQPMRRQNQVRLTRNQQTPSKINPIFLEPLNFLPKNNRVYHNTVTYHIHSTFVKNPRRNCMKHVLYTIKFKRMTRIRTSLKARNNIISLC